MSVQWAGVPAQAVLPLGTRTVDALREDARISGQRWLHADCGRARSKSAVMVALARGLELPAHFGGNLDALYDCVTDLAPLPGVVDPGVVMVVENLHEGRGFDAEQIDSLLDVFRDAADFHRERGIAFRVFYSLSEPVVRALP